MSNNVRPETMERITTPELANAFIEEKIAELREQVANLQKAPGEETTKVDETTGEDAPAATTSKDLFDSIKDIL